jgi:hypothetical protein
VTAYATLDQLRQYLPAANAADANALADLLERASRAIDSYCHRPPEAFVPAPAEPKTRTLYGGGVARLEAGELISLVSVVGPGGAVSAVYLRRALLRTDPATERLTYEPWELGVPYAVTGRWGFEVTPADITEACLQLAVRWWRGKDEAFSGVVGAIEFDRTIIERDFPPTVKRLLAPYVLATSDATVGRWITNEFEEGW